jgi:Xaa-Pro aminopeptidase
MQQIKDAAFKEIANRIKSGNPPKEYEIQHFMHNLMRENNLIWGDGPVVAVNEHAADPHFEPTPENSYSMQVGDLVLIDLGQKSISWHIIMILLDGLNRETARVPEKFKIVSLLLPMLRRRQTN